MIKSLFKFSNGQTTYQQFDTEYNRHNKGLVILGPSGIGKTFFVNRQNNSQNGKKDWIDMDYLCGVLGADWHQNEDNKDDFKLNYMRVDYLLEQSKMLGYHIIGALYWEYQTDAIVIPPLNIHSEYVKKREDLTLTRMMNERKTFQEHGKKYGIPIFDSIEKAINHLLNANTIE
jgi:hypothetical protein